MDYAIVILVRKGLGHQSLTPLVLHYPQINQTNIGIWHAFMRGSLGCTHIFIVCDRTYSVRKLLLLKPSHVSTLAWEWSIAHFAINCPNKLKSFCHGWRRRWIWYIMYGTYNTTWTLFAICIWSRDFVQVNEIWHRNTQSHDNRRKLFHHECLNK